MQSTVVNAIGDACPIPVVKAKKALGEMQRPGLLEVHVDNETAVENLKRLAASQGLQAGVEKKEEKHFIVCMRVETGVPADTQAEAPACALPVSAGYVVCIDAEHMGRGDDVLGATLMKGFIYALSQLETLPEAILFYNGGVKLSVEGSPALEDLKAMQAQGVEVLSCGTCLNFYGLSEKLAVGSVTNMYTIVEKLTGAGKVVKP